MQNFYQNWLLIYKNTRKYIVKEKSNNNSNEYIRFENNTIYSNIFIGGW